MLREEIELIRKIVKEEIAQALADLEKKMAKPAPAKKATYFDPPAGSGDFHK